LGQEQGGVAEKSGFVFNYAVTRLEVFCGKGASGVGLEVFFERQGFGSIAESDI